MLVTREMDYTLRILRALCRSGQLSAAAVAKQEHMPKAITLKLLKQLAAAGLVESRRGAAGGYLLARAPGELTLYDLFEAVGERILVNRCQQGGYQCENSAECGCGMCAEFGRIQRVLDEALRRASLSEIFAPEGPAAPAPPQPTERDDG